MTILRMFGGIAARCGRRAERTLPYECSDRADRLKPNIVFSKRDSYQRRGHLTVCKVAFFRLTLPRTVHKFAHAFGLRLTSRVDYLGEFPHTTHSVMCTGYTLYDVASFRPYDLDQDSRSPRIHPKCCPSRPRRRSPIIFSREHRRPVQNSGASASQSKRKCPLAGELPVDTRSARSTQAASPRHRLACSTSAAREI